MRNALTDDESEIVRQHLLRIVQKLGSQTATSQALGISQVGVSKILSGGLVGLDVARRVAQYLGMSLADLLNETETIH